MEPYWSIFFCVTIQDLSAQGLYDALWSQSLVLVSPMRWTHLQAVIAIFTGLRLLPVKVIPKRSPRRVVEGRRTGVRPVIVGPSQPDFVLERWLGFCLWQRQED